VTSPSERKAWRARLLRRLVFRRTCAHCWTLLVYAFNFLLAGLVLVLAVTLLSRDIPVPDILVDRIETELRRRGLEFGVASARFDPTGRIYVTGLQLRPSRFGEPIFEAARALITLDRLKLLALKPDLAELEIEDVKLLCPASISPSGIPETVARIATGRIRHAGGLWTIDALVGQIDQLTINAHGSYTAAPPRPEGKPPDIEMLLDAFAEYAPRAVRYEQHLDAVELPFLEIEFAGSLHAGVAVDITFSAHRVFEKEYGEARHILLRAETTFGGTSQRPLVATARVGELRHPTFGHARNLRLQALWPQPPLGGASPWPERVDATLAHFRREQAAIAGAIIHARPREYPQISATLFTRFAGENIAATLRGDIESRSGAIDLRTRLGRDWLPALSRILGRDVTYYAAVDTPPDITAHATIAPGARLDHATFRVLSGPILARGVHLDRARVIGHGDLQDVYVDHMEIQRGDEWAIGTYHDHLPTRDIRIMLRGALRPMAIAPWFGDWWGRFWGDFAFPGPPPTFDVDIHNNWLRHDAYRLLGRTRAEQITCRGVAIDWLQSGFRVAHNFYDLFDASIGRPEGRVDGEVQLLYRTGQKDPLRQNWRFKSTADLVELAKIFGPGGEALFEPYRYSIPPAVVARGDIVNDAGKLDTDIDLVIASGNEFRYYDFPVDALSTDVSIRNNRVELPNLRAEYAGGLITARAVVVDDTLTVDARLEDADYDRAVSTFNAFLDRRNPPPPGEAEPSGFAARQINGRLDIEVSATGPLTDITGYEGRGNVRIRNGDLARFRLFGPIGDILRPIGIRIGTLQLTDAYSDFEIRKNEIYFPNLQFTGRTEAIQGEGTYRISDGALSFRMRLYPLRESDGALTQLFGALLDPVSNLMEMRLTGTLSDPKWTLTNNPFANVREPPPIPEKPAAPATEPSPPAQTEPPADAAPIDSAATPPAPESSSAPAPAAPETTGDTAGSGEETTPGHEAQSPAPVARPESSESLTAPAAPAAPAAPIPPDS